MPFRGGWWLKWNIIPSRWRIWSIFALAVTFVIDLPKVVCALCIESETSTAVLCTSNGQILLEKRSRLFPLLQNLNTTFYLLEYKVDHLFANLPGQKEANFSSFYILIFFNSIFSIFAQCNKNSKLVSTDQLRERKGEGCWQRFTTRQPWVIQPSLPTIHLW